MSAGGQGVCTGCGRSKPITITGLVYRHRGPGGEPCPGQSQAPEGAGVAPATVAATLDQLIQDLRVHNLPGHGAVVRLDDVTTAIDNARVSARLEPLGATDG
ncbi:hypothetical protein AB0H37_24885 [Actinomadura sp. NPDC023710]|uniref:hypothetical protein n=1 Tax=Actinomadura sp. NPDC023710 TaxID=3158219 RepID=UPI003408C1FB